MFICSHCKAYFPKTPPVSGRVVQEIKLNPCLSEWSKISYCACGVRKSGLIAMELFPVWRMSLIWIFLIWSLKLIVWWEGLNTKHWWNLWSYFEGPDPSPKERECLFFKIPLSSSYSSIKYLHRFYSQSLRAEEGRGSFLVFFNITMQYL